MNPSPPGSPSLCPAMHACGASRTRTHPLSWCTECITRCSGESGAPAARAYSSARCCSGRSAAGMPSPANVGCAPSRRRRRCCCGGACGCATHTPLSPTVLGFLLPAGAGVAGGASAATEVTRREGGAGRDAGLTADPRRTAARPPPAAGGRPPRPAGGSAWPPSPPPPAGATVICGYCGSTPPSPATTAPCGLLPVLRLVPQRQELRPRRFPPDGPALLRCQPAADKLEAAGCRGSPCHLLYAPGRWVPPPPLATPGGGVGRRPSCGCAQGQLLAMLLHACTGWVLAGAAGRWPMHSRHAQAAARSAPEGRGGGRPHDAGCPPARDVLQVQPE